MKKYTIYTVPLVLIVIFFIFQYPNFMDNPEELSPIVKTPKPKKTKKPQLDPYKSGMQRDIEFVKANLDRRIQEMAGKEIDKLVKLDGSVICENVKIVEWHPFYVKVSKGENIEKIQYNGLSKNSRAKLSYDDELHFLYVKYAEEFYKK